jgi:membrane protein
MVPDVHRRRAPEAPFQNSILAWVWRYFAREIWQVDLGTVSRPRAALLKFCRIGFLSARGFVQDDCFFRASGLTYITVLGLVPLLAFVFAIAKGFGAVEVLENKLRPALLSLLGETPVQPAGVVEAGQAAVDAAGDAVGDAAASGGSLIVDTLDTVLEVVRGADAKNLGTPAFLLLIYTTYKMLTSVEGSLNDIWGVAKARTWLRRITDYSTLLLIVPVLILAGISFTSANIVATTRDTLATDWKLGPLIEMMGNFGPLLVVSFAFAFLFLTMPNTRTHIRSALLGGLIAGILFQGAQLLHVKLQVGVAKASAVYGVFAAIPIFLAWVQVSWTTVLVGAEVAFAHQYEPAYRQIASSDEHHDHAITEVIALRSILRICRAFHRGDTPPNAADIAAVYGLPPRHVEEVLMQLVRARVLAETDLGEQDGFLPARDPGQLTILGVLDALKGSGRLADVPAQGRMDEELDRILESFHREARDSQNNRTLRDLMLAADHEYAPIPRVSERRARSEDVTGDAAEREIQS